MKKRSEVFRKAFLICMTLLIFGNVVLALSYTYFAQKAYFDLEQAELNQMADSIQVMISLLFEKDVSESTLRQYFNALLQSNDISFVAKLCLGCTHPRFYATQRDHRKLGSSA